MIAFSHKFMVCVLLVASFLGGLWVGHPSAQAQSESARPRSNEPSRTSDKRVLIEPYTGPPIFLDEKRVVVPPTIVNRQPDTDKYPDGKIRVERQIARFSDDHFESDGYYREFHPNGAKFIEGQYRNGRQDGKWSYYFDNGQLQRQASFQAGQLHGSWENYRADGTLAAKRSYENGLRHGEWMTYDATGKQPLTEDHYIQGKLDGISKLWHPNGQLRRQATLKDGVRNGPTSEWDKDGKQTTHGNYVDNKLEGPAWYVRDDGRKMIQEYKAGRLISERAE
jgi:antitoxin component YwqK of YwqJK toxin-antitoxin module